MQILLNGEPTEIPEGMTMAQLIDHLALGQRRLAVEVNETLIPRGHFEHHRLAPEDRVEIIQAVGGG